MTSKAAKTEMMRAHEAMALVLDVKLKDLPEWQAFRAIDRALLALDSVDEPKAPNPMPRPRISGAPESYTALTGKALDEAGGPLSFSALIDFIGKHRDLGDDIKRAKINISTTLSKDDRYKNIEWGNGRAWWYADRPIPAPAPPPGPQITAPPWVQTNPVPIPLPPKKMFFDN